MDTARYRLQVSLSFREGKNPGSGSKILGTGKKNMKDVKESYENVRCNDHQLSSRSMSSEQVQANDALKQAHVLLN